MKQIKIVVDGDIIPAARPRFSGRRCYQPKRNVEFRQRVQEAARLAMNGAEPMTLKSCVVSLKNTRTSLTPAPKFFWRQFEKRHCVFKRVYKQKSDFEKSM